MSAIKRWIETRLELESIMTPNKMLFIPLRKSEILAEILQEKRSENCLINEEQKTL